MVKKVQNNKNKSAKSSKKNKLPSTLPVNNIFGQLPLNIGNLNNIGTLTKIQKTPIQPYSRLVALVVTIHGGSSYDKVFQTVQQKSQRGTHVLVYQCQSRYIKQIIKGFINQSQVPQVKQLMDNIKSLQSDCVVFNWQCSSAYSSSRFEEGSGFVMDLLNLIINRGHMAMFSDFSLKALIANWDERILGPKCLIQTGQHSGATQVRFDPIALRCSPSAQLQSIGQLSAGGLVNVHAAGNTIVYTVDFQKVDTSIYQVQILSVVPTCKQDKLVCRSRNWKGSAGHTLIRYNTGGIILTSMGHWVQLMKIDVTQKNLFDKAVEDYGQEYAKGIQQQYEQFDEAGKQVWMQNKAKQFIQNRAPCNNLERKKKQEKKQ